MSLTSLRALSVLYRHLRLRELPCPGCGGDERRLLLRRDRHFLRIDVSHCLRCGLVHAARGYDPGDDARFYREIYPVLASRRPRLTEVQHRDAAALAAWRWRWIVGRIGRPAGLLDVGCGAGLLLAEARRHGVPLVRGVEPDPVSRAVCAGLGLGGVVAGSLDELASSGAAQAPVVTLFHVLEHLPDPVAALRRLAVCVSDALVVEVPDIEGDLSSLGIRNFHVSHRSYFTAATLANLLADGGFAIESEVRDDGGGAHPAVIRVVARPAGTARPARRTIDDPTKRIRALARPWSLRNGYARGACRLLKLALQPAPRTGQ